MSDKRPHIYFRADASEGIGYGHFVRTLALADMLGDAFIRTFATRHPTPYQVEQMTEICDDYMALGDAHFDEFINLLHDGDIVILDNYFYDTEYQRAIKAKGCKLVCIDDTHDKHYVADVVINHGLDDPELFSVEPYTKLCLGLDWALLREPFLEAKPYKIREKGHCVVSFGGVDTYNLTGKVCGILSAKSEVFKITAIVGDAYAYFDTLQGVDKVEIRKNLSAQEMADMFCRVEFAVLPASTVCLEAIACKCNVISGYFVDNQVMPLQTLVKNNRVVNIEDLRKIKDVEIPEKWALNLSPVMQNTIKNYNLLFSKWKFT